MCWSLEDDGRREHAAGEIPLQGVANGTVTTIGRLNFAAPERKGEQVVVNADYVSQQVGSLIADENLSRYIL